MKNFAILCSIVYCGIFCHTLYSQNITDSAITAVKDMQVDTVDNVTVKIKKRVKRHGQLQIFSTRDCIEIFRNLNDSLFNPWNEDIDKVSGTIGLPAEDNP